MRRMMLFVLAIVMLLQCACAAVPQDIISNEDVSMLMAENEDSKIVYTSEYAYVRGGNEWANKNWHQILEERGRKPMLIMKNGKAGNNVTRLALLRFDISDLTIADVGRAELAVNFTDIQSGTNVPFDIYLVDNAWSEASVTYNTQPSKLNNTPVAEGVVLKNVAADVTSAVKTMIGKGESSVTLMLVQAVETETETKIEFSKLEASEMPRLVINKNGTSGTAGTLDANEGVNTVKNFYTVDYAYVRGSSKWNSKNWNEINEELGNGKVLYIKNGLQTGEVARRALFRFDISGLEYSEIGFAELCIRFTDIEANTAVYFDLYLVDDNWSGNTVTWNTQPQKLNETPVILNAVFGGLSNVDATEFIKKMVLDGKKTFSLMLVQLDETDTVTKINIESVGSSGMPHFAVYSDRSAGDAGYVKQLVKDETENKAIWDHAKKMYDEWYARYLTVKEKPLGTPELIESDPTQFDKTVMSPGSNPSGTMVKRATRTVDSLKDLSEYVDITEETKLDKYGGIIDDTRRRETTGFFYTEKIGDRWWVIDPLGYPCVLKSVSGVTVSYQNSPTQKAAYLEKFGAPEKWAISTTRHLKNDLAFNCASTSDDSIYEVVDGLAYFKRFGVMSSYTSSLGINVGQGGQARFSENNTMPVFDPEFESFAYSKAASNVVPNDQNMIAYITDNELPMDLTMLKDYLTIDPTKKVNRYSYACAWYWVTQMTGKENVSDADITPELMDLFRGFVWDRDLYVVDSAIEKYDPNHLYAGTKYLNWSKESEWVLRFSAEYVDILTINWYGAWEPQAEYIYSFARYADAPFMVTEFYAKSSDTFDKLACKDGAGFYVKTQAERGLFYQNYTLRLLEAKNCVGWQWFQYTDNDPAGNPTDISSRDANKGIVNNRHEEYTDLTDDMALINKNVYKLIEYFDSKSSK